MWCETVISVSGIASGPVYTHWVSDVSLKMANRQFYISTIIM